MSDTDPIPQPPFDNLDTAHVWRLVHENEAALRGSCMKMLPKNMRHELEELYSDVVLSRAVSIMRTYDHTKGASPISHLVIAVKWYAFKWVVKKTKKAHAGETLLDSMSVDESPNRDRTIEAYDLLDRLPRPQADLLRWRFVQGCDAEEIAEHLGITVREAKLRLSKAMRSIRSIAMNDDHIDESDGE